jgi:hypothetical protein
VDPFAAISNSPNKISWSDPDLPEIEVSKTIAVAPTPPKSLRIWIIQALAWLAQRLIFWA